jgi:hypothetical protein
MVPFSSPTAPSSSRKSAPARPRARPTSSAIAATEAKENRKITPGNSSSQAVDAPDSSIPGHTPSEKKKKRQRKDSFGLSPEKSSGSGSSTQGSSQATILADINDASILSLEANALALAPSQLPAHLVNVALCPFCDEPLPLKPSRYLDNLLKQLRSRPNVRKRNGSYNPDALWLPSIESVIACRRHQEECDIIPNGLAQGWPKEDEVDWDQLPG